MGKQSLQLSKSERNRRKGIPSRRKTENGIISFSQEGQEAGNQASRERKFGAKRILGGCAKGSGVFQRGELDFGLRNLARETSVGAKESLRVIGRSENISIPRGEIKDMA